MSIALIEICLTPITSTDLCLLRPKSHFPVPGFRNIFGMSKHLEMIKKKMANYFMYEYIFFLFYSVIILSSFFIIDIKMFQLIWYIVICLVVESLLFLQCLLVNKEYEKQLTRHTLNMAPYFDLLLRLIMIPNLNRNSYIPTSVKSLVKLPVLVPLHCKAYKF